MREKTYMSLMSKMEDKLVELMGVFEYERFSRQIAKSVFLEEVKETASKEFEEFVQENEDYIFRENRIRRADNGK